MLTCCPQLLHSFVYKVPVWGLNLLTPLGLMDLARFVCSRDLIIAEVSLIFFCIFVSEQHVPCTCLCLPCVSTVHISTCVGCISCLVCSCMKVC